MHRLDRQRYAKVGRDRVEMFQRVLEHAPGMAGGVQDSAATVEH
jgi:hypothetical protein